MNSRLAGADHWRIPLTFAAIVVLTALAWPGAAQAQDKDFSLAFSTKSGVTTPGASLLLRPNVAQDFFIYVKNLNAKNGMLRVEIRANGKVIDGGASKPFPVAAGQPVTQVVLGNPPEKPPVPPATPAPPAPPALAEVKGQLEIVLLDSATNQVLSKAPLVYQQPKEYVEAKISFNPKPVGDKKNQLRVTLKANPETFAGPRCRVELVLDPQRIPDLQDAKKTGTRGGYLAEPGAELVLTADNLEFKSDKEQTGFVYLTIDGWERAYAFTTTFRRDATPAEVNTPVVRLLAPTEWNPAKPLPVKLEADNLDKQIVELGFDHDNDGKFSKLNGEILDFAGDRQQRLFINPAFPEGALQLKREARDWATNLDVMDVYGPRSLRVRLLKSAEEAAKPKDEDRAIDTNLNKAFGSPEIVTELRQVVVLDGSPPEGVKFVNLPAKLFRGEPLPLSAVGVDPESGIKEVLFFVGKPGPDGKLPPNAIQAAGKLTDAKKGIWSAALEAPTDQKGKFDVTVQFVNGANLVTADTIKIELVDPVKEGVGKSSIAGKVTDVAGRPQGKGIPVVLRDDKGAIKDQTVTDEKSEYIFKDVAPGTYRITSVRTGNSTSGAAATTVMPGEKKTDVDVKLSR